MMTQPAIPPSNEGERLTRLQKLMVLDTLPEAVFDEITKIAAELCDTPIALISLVDENRQWFKSNVGLVGATETPRDVAFCSHAILGDDVMEVPDATSDNRFKNNPLVTSDPNIRFYAGAPIEISEGINIGTLCVIDKQARYLTATQKTMLSHLSGVVAKALLAREQFINKINQNEILHTNIVESSNDAIISKSLDGTVLSWNVAAEKIFGYSDEEIIGQSILKIFPKNRIHEESDFVGQIKKRQKVESFETERITKLGNIIYVSTTLSPILNLNDEVIGISSISRDITNHKLAEIAFTREHERLKVTMDSIGDAVITTNNKGFVEYLNPVAEKLTGWTSNEAKGLLLNDVFKIINETSRKPLPNPVDICLLENRIVGLANHTILISRDGTEYGIEDSAAPIRNQQGETLGVVLVFHDVTVQRQMANEMSYRATHDPLTGLINRGEFEHRLERLLIHTTSNTQHALMFIDLDQFKVVNDTCGHPAGDKLLKEITKVIEQCIRNTDTLARIGGDEFAIILEKCDAEPAMRIAQLVCKNVDEYRFTHEEKRFRIGTSIGLVIMNDHWSSIQTLIQAADSACYAAKEAGRNRVHLYYDADFAVETRRGEIQWASRIEQAMEDNQFVLFCQRIVPLREHSGLHAEVLIRLQDVNGNIVPPGAFLPAAERFHMASRIDKWVVKNVFSWLHQNQHQIPHIDSIAINLSGQSIGDEAFHDYVLMLISTTPIDFSKVCFEITETATITNINLATRFIQTMKHHQIKFSLDDFGSGASSFGYLKSLDVDYLKIDGQFIKDIHDDPVDLATVRCILEIAKVTGKKTIAEWVETVEVENILRRLGADYVQGYLRHKPEPIDQLLIVNHATNETIPQVTKT